MGVVISRFDVHLVRLAPTFGAEMRKTRPYVVISPNVLNQNLGTVIVAPMTSRIRTYPCRVTVRFQGQSGEIALDQLRSVDQQRLVRRLGALDQPTAERVLEVLAALFAP